MAVEKWAEMSAKSIGNSVDCTDAHGRVTHGVIEDVYAEGWFLVRFEDGGTLRLQRMPTEH